MIWFLIFVAGLITFFTRYSMIAFVDPNTLSKTTKKILTFIPSAVFPAIIFPAIFLNDKGLFVGFQTPEVWAFCFSIIIGYLTKNIIITIFFGLIFYWSLIYFF